MALPSRLLSLLLPAVGKADSNGVLRKTSLSTSGWTHPSILRFKKPWQGFLYWAAITPYPATDSQYENPHIFCSNDGIKWQEPVGIINPIEGAPQGVGYNSDVNLLFDDGILYCYWRANLSGIRALLVSSTTDGIHWSEKQKICDWISNKVDVISPSVLKENGLYYCYGVSNYETTPGNYFNNICIRRMISNDPVKGFNPDRENGYEQVKITNRPWGTNQDPWHLEVRKVKNIWIMLVTTTNHFGYGSGGRLFMGYSTDGMTFVFANKPISTFSGTTYKSSFIVSIDAKTNSLKIELWRAMMSFGWSVFYDKFIVKMESSPSV